MSSRGGARDPNRAPSSVTDRGGSAGPAGLHPCRPSWRLHRDRAFTDLSGSYFSDETAGEGQLVETET